MSTIPEFYSGVTVRTKANVYFDGRVVSHTVEFPEGVRKTLGLIYPGSYHFGTKQAERMEIVAGECRVKIDGATAETEFKAGQVFDVPANSGFDIAAASGICEYICTFVD